MLGEHPTFEETELGLRVLLAEDQAWLFAALVDKSLRRRGVYSRMLKFIVTELANQGLPHQLVAVNPNNLASKHAHRQYALRQSGTVVAVRLLNVGCCLAFGTIDQSNYVTWNAAKRPIEIRIQTGEAEGELLPAEC